MFFSFAMKGYVIKVNPTVVEKFAENLNLADVNGQFDKVQRMSQSVIPAIEDIPTQQFGFTQEFKTEMLKCFQELEQGEYYAIVDSYLTPEAPESQFWWEYLKEINNGTDSSTAQELANKIYKNAHEDYQRKRQERDL